MAARAVNSGPHPRDSRLRTRIGAICGVIAFLAFPLPSSSSWAQSQEPVDQTSAELLVHDRILLIQHTVDTHWHTLTQLVIDGITSGADVESMNAFRTLNSDLRESLKSIEREVREDGGLTALGKFQFSEIVVPYLKIKPIASSILQELEQANGDAALQIYQSEAVPLYVVALKSLALMRVLEFENSEK
jgi:hypothetical protein